MCFNQIGMPCKVTRCHICMQPLSWCCLCHVIGSMKEKTFQMVQSPAGCGITAPLPCSRLWQKQLKSYDLTWAASGVCPVPNRCGSQSWKELVATSVRLQPAGIGGDVLASPQAVCHKGLSLWNSGQPWLYCAGTTSQTSAPVLTHV